MLRRSSFLAGVSFSALVVSTGSLLADGYSRGYARPVEPNWIVESNNQVGIQYKQIHFDYLETLPDGTPFNEEVGWVPGFGVSVTLMQKWILPRFYFNAQFSYYNGKTDYTDFVALDAKHPAIVKDLDFRFGNGFDLHRSVMVTPFLGIGYRNWYRDVLQYDETYSHGYYGAGVLLQVSPHAGLVLSADALIGHTFDSKIKISDIPNFAPGSTLPLGDSNIIKLGLSADYAITRSLHVNTGVEWSSFKYGESPLDPTGSYNEPDSRTHHVAFRVGVGYAFGGRDHPAPLK